MLAKKYTDRLQEIQDNIRNSHEYFNDNINRFHDFMKFVFDTSISSSDETKLNTLQKPVIEFNILEAYISRLKGEFAKQEPTITVRAADGVRLEELTEEFIATLDVIGAHIRAILNESTNDSLQWSVYSEILGGGYSVVKVYTDYINEMSFEQNIKVSKAFDSTLTGFDPMARESHKGDGDYCFELIPKTREDFVKEFGSDALKGMKFVRSTELSGFNWSYANQSEDVVLVADYYCKRKRKEKIVKLSNGHIILKPHYEDFIKMWNSQGFIEQAPIIISERDTTITDIERFVLCETGILKHEETFYRYLPLVFVDGNSVIIRDTQNSASKQMTRPYVYQAKGVQQLKNFSGQTIAAEIENMVQHKFIVAAESIPEDYVDAYKNVQQASTLIYNAFYEGDPANPLPPPREVQRTPTPPIVENTFMGTDQVSQVILGTYDSVLGTNDKQISGVAIQQGAMQSNAAALPYLMGYIKGQNRVAEIIIDLIPKIYVTPRSLPVLKADGKRSYQVINKPTDPTSVDFSYNPDSLQVKIEAGVSSGVQKQVAIDQIIRMSQASEVFANFINSMGLETILDNLDIRGIEELKAQAVIFMEQQQEAQQRAQEEGDPLVKVQQEQTQAFAQIEMAKVEQQSIKAEGEIAIQAAKVANEKQLIDIKAIETMAKIEQGNVKLALDQEKVDAENSRSAVETAINFAGQLGKGSNE